MSRVVTGFLSKDNKFFESKEECDNHERSLDFINWYKKLDNKERLSSVSGEKLSDWLYKNKGNVFSLLGESHD